MDFQQPVNPAIEGNDAVAAPAIAREVAIMPSTMGQSPSS